MPYDSLHNNSPSGDDSEPDLPEGEPAEDMELKAFRALRHAIADGDDEAGAEALKHCLTIYGHGEEDEEGDDQPKSRPKPNLAMILMAKRKKKD
jgi:hypothetical protein